jgi:hypothetical protein
MNDGVNTVEYKMGRKRSRWRNGKGVDNNYAIRRLKRISLILRAVGTIEKYNRKLTSLGMTI